jgi:hypothetical protein
MFHRKGILNSFLRNLVIISNGKFNYLFPNTKSYLQNIEKRTNIKGSQLRLNELIFTVSKKSFSIAKIIAFTTNQDIPVKASKAFPSEYSKAANWYGCRNRRYDSIHRMHDFG